ncbi:ATP-binding cassette domain-containing protein [Candidatus Woesebacteria bacterium]|nr:ATP-binding cassette domain-containing protein [Candidatus Woesebacteria bacterium]
MLKFKGVSKTFGSITALEDIDLDISKGEFVFITGPSGSGKTTLLRLILRELLPDKGEIVIAGEDITKMPRKLVPELRQQIGTVFQDFKVLDERTLEENIEIALAVLGISQKEWEKRIENVLELTGLTERRKLFPSQLSGGELQRVSLARALVINPKLILADEPTGNLDWETAQELMELFKQIHKEGKTIIMATHHRGLVDNEDFREIVLNRGKVTGESKDDEDEKKDKHVTGEKDEHEEKDEKVESSDESEKDRKEVADLKHKKEQTKDKIKLKDKIKMKFKK